LRARNTSTLGDRSVSRRWTRARGLDPLRVAPTSTSITHDRRRAERIHRRVTRLGRKTYAERTGRAGQLGEVGDIGIRTGEFRPSVRREHGDDRHARRATGRNARRRVLEHDALAHVDTQELGTQEIRRRVGLARARELRRDEGCLIDSSATSTSEARTSRCWFAHGRDSGPDQQIAGVTKVR